MSENFSGHVPVKRSEEDDSFFGFKLFESVGNVGIVHVFGERAKFTDVLGLS